ncbi:MAG: Asp23/Gls24 family envelope stress response protein [Lentisphaeria bacterium]
MSEENLNKDKEIPQTKEHAEIQDAGEIAISEDNNEGSIQISNNVIASIVRKYTLEVEGVIRFSPQGIVEGIADILSKRNYDRSICIELGDGEAEISLILILRFGVSLVDVAKKIQATIKEKVELLCGIKVSKVNVFVREVEEEHKEVEKDEEVEPPVDLAE